MIGPYVYLIYVFLYCLFIYELTVQHMFRFTRVFDSICLITFFNHMSVVSLKNLKMNSQHC